METTTKTIESINVVGMPHRGAYWKIGETFGKLVGWAHQNQVPFTGTIAVYCDDPNEVPEADLKSDALLIVDDVREPADGIVSYEIPAGKYFVGLHKGSYQHLGAAWNELYSKDLHAAGAKTREGYVFERYLNDCMTVPEADLLTELYIPIA